jgi:hypothetical protein
MIDTEKQNEKRMDQLGLVILQNLMSTLPCTLSLD